MKIITVFIFLAVFLTSACNRFSHKNTSCSLYTYNEQTKSWVDSAGRPAICSIADGKRIFNWIPPKGCQHWVDMFAIDTSAKVSEIVIRTGDVAKKYCVLQRYISLNDSGQVLVIGGEYCLREQEPPMGGGGKEYTMLNSCSKSSSPAVQQK